MNEEKKMNKKETDLMSHGWRQKISYVYGSPVLQDIYVLIDVGVRYFWWFSNLQFLPQNKRMVWSDKLWHVLHIYIFLYVIQGQHHHEYSMWEKCFFISSAGQ